MLRDQGYVIYDVSPWGREFSMVKKKLLADLRYTPQPLPRQAAIVVCVVKNSAARWLQRSERLVSPTANRCWAAIIMPRRVRARDA